MSASLQTTTDRNSDRHVVIAAAIITAIDLLVLVIGLTMLADGAYEASYGDFLPQDVWQPFAVLAWSTALANGAGLAFWRPTRPVGLGILYATIGVALLMVGYFALALMSMGS